MCNSWHKVSSHCWKIAINVHTEHKHHCHVIKMKGMTVIILTVQYLIISGIGYQILGVHRPVKMGDETRVTLR